MELNVLEKKKGRVVFEVPGADHTFCQALKSELWNDKTVTVATYAVKHPLIPVPKFIVEAEDASKSVKEASKRLQKAMKSVKSTLAKA